MKGVRRAHSIDLALCEDENCSMLHVVLCDEEDEVFAECVFEPTPDWLGEFFNTLIEICFIARMREKMRQVKH